MMPFGEFLLVTLIRSKREFLTLTSSTIQSALKILWRQCSELAWANIINSASVGFLSSFE